jgi:hypothetical protein
LSPSAGGAAFINPTLKKIQHLFHSTAEWPK